MTRMDAECVVVGGGPAGLVAAIALASASIETVLIAKAVNLTDPRTTALLHGNLCHTVDSVPASASNSLSPQYVRNHADPIVAAANSRRNDASSWRRSRGTTRSPKGVVHRNHDMAACSEPYTQGSLNTAET